MNDSCQSGKNNRTLQHFMCLRQTHKKLTVRVITDVAESTIIDFRDM